MTRIENKHGLLIARSDTHTKSVDADIILVPCNENEPAPKGWHLIPEKVAWHLSTPESGDAYLMSLSHNRRKRMKKSLLLFADVHCEDPVTKETFLSWYALYAAGMKNKLLATPVIDKTWLDQKEAGSIYGLFIYAGKKLLGGILCKRLSDPSVCSIAYTALDEDAKEHGLNDALNYHLVLLAQQKECALISRGQDTNRYGHHLSTGLYLYKTSLGYAISAHPKSTWAHMNIIHIAKFHDPMFFVAKENDLCGILITNGCEQSYENTGLHAIRTVLRSSLDE